jgi:hypothetical protein
MLYLMTYVVMSALIMMVLELFGTKRLTAMDVLMYSLFGWIILPTVAILDGPSWVGRSLGSVVRCIDDRLGKISLIDLRKDKRK